MKIPEHCAKALFLPFTAIWPEYSIFAPKEMPAFEGCLLCAAPLTKLPLET